MEGTQSPPNQIRYTYEDKLEEDLTSAKHASQPSQMEFGRGPSPPNQFRYTFEDELEEEMTSAKHASQTSAMDFGRDPSPSKQFRYTFEDKLEEEMSHSPVPQRRSESQKIKDEINKPLTFSHVGDSCVFFIYLCV